MITPSESRQKQRSAASLNKKETAMKTTYRLLVQSEEKNRNILEIALYGLVALSVLAAIWQFADEPAMPTYQIGTAIAHPIEMGS